VNKSLSLYDEAGKYMVGGVSAAGRFHGVLGRPLFLESAEGSRLYDIDGNEYVDFYNSAGAAFFGYNHPRLRGAVERALEGGFFMNFETEHHSTLAKMLCDVIPSAESVRLSNTGTEVTMAAIRVARAYTGKDKILKFEGHFHGMHECIFYNHGKLGKIDEYGEIETVPDSDGFPGVFRESVVVVEFNNPAAIRHAFKKYKGQIAGVIMEPISFNCGCMPARKEFLEEVRHLCNQEGAVLIFDEVLSGFRMCIGGAQEWYGVTPDLTTLAKALGGGFPIAALVGKQEVMSALNPRGRAIVSGTYTGALMPVLVAIECLKMMMEPGFYERLNTQAGRLYSGLAELFRRYRIPGHVRGIGARFALFFGVDDPNIDYKFRDIVQCYDVSLYKRFVELALKQGLYFHFGGWALGGVATPEHCGITAAHSAQDIDLALEKFEKVFAQLQQELP